MTTEPTIPELLELTEGQLYVALGAQLLSEGQGFGLEDVSRARRYAKAWLDERTAELQKRVCNASSVKKLIDKETLDLAADMIAITAVLDSQLKSHALASIVAAIIARRGLRVYCEVESPK
jgi:hypothetical protein